MLVGVCRRSAFSKFSLSTSPRQPLLCLHRFRPRPSALSFSTFPRLRNQHGSEHVTPKEQRRKDWLVVRKLIGNVWPKHDWNTRLRVVLGFALLISGKVPLLFNLVRDCHSSSPGLERTSPTIIQGCHRRSQSRRLVYFHRLGRRGLPHPRLCVASSPHTPSHALLRRCRPHRSDRIRRTAECSVRQHRSACHTQGLSRNL